MSRADALIAKLNSTLNKFFPGAVVAYKRLITRTGGDPLIGREGTVSYTDTILNPQPWFNREGRQHIAGGHARSETVLDSNNKAVIADDWSVLLSPTAMSADELDNKDICLVLIYPDGTEEMLRLLDYESVGLNGEDVVYTAYFRSAKRP